MDPNYRKSERGQALVLIVIGMIVLLGFTALAIDGSMIYSERRYAQNVADAAALAAASQAALSLENGNINYSNWDCNSSQISTARTIAVNTAINRAADNDVALDADISDDHGVLVSCGVDTSGGAPDKYLDVLVKVSADTSTSLMHFVYEGVVTNKVEAVARVRPRVTGSTTSGGGDAAILGLSTEPGCGGSEATVKFHGTAEVRVFRGNIHSNGCLRFGGGPTVTVTDGFAYYVSEKDTPPDSDPPAEQTSTIIAPESLHLPVPDCASQPARSVPSGGGSLLPGRYQDMRFNASNVHYDLGPGLYCVVDELTWNGGSASGTGVTIVVESGALTISGNFQTNLAAPNANATPASVAPAVPGLLFYLPPDNSSTVKLAGTIDTNFTGVVLAPSSLLMIEGTGANGSYYGMYVGWNVDAGGDAKTWIKYYPNNVFTLTESQPTKIELYK